MLRAKCVVKQRMVRQFHRSARPSPRPQNLYPNMTHFSPHILSITTGTNTHSNITSFNSRLIATGLGSGSGVLMAGGMREGMWSFSPNRTPEKHLPSPREEYLANQYESQVANIRKQDEKYADWVEGILKTNGQWFEEGDVDVNDPVAIAAQEKKDSEFLKKLDDIYDQIERYRTQPENYIWCQSYLKDIFRFCNEDGMKQTYKVRLGGDQLKNMIRYKTFVEKEKYKFLRDRESILEIQTQYMHNLAALYQLLKDQQIEHLKNEEEKRNSRLTSVGHTENQFNAFNKPFEDEIFVHKTLQPIYKTLEDTMMTIIEITDFFEPVLTMSLQFDAACAAEVTKHERGKALEILQQHAAVILGATKTTRSLLQFMDDKLYEFEEYYSPERVRNLLEYARLEAQPTKRHYLDSVSLPPPPLLDVSSVTYYDSIHDNTEGVVGSFQPDSWPYHPIEHIPLTERLLNPDISNHNIILTPHERTARFKLNRDELSHITSKVEDDLLSTRLERQLAQTNAMVESSRLKDHKDDVKSKLDGQISINDHENKNKYGWR